MNINKITKDYSVSGQIQAIDVVKIKEQGFSSVFCLRPDNEADVQPEQESIAKACKEQGLSFVYYPIITANLNSQMVDGFSELFDKETKPILAYCGSGQRAAFVYLLMFKKKNLDIEPMLSASLNYGYNLKDAVYSFNK